MKKFMEKVLSKKMATKVKKLNNNKGFSLVELLIVIAIMGVLAVIAFNMFGGVLQNSKKRADAQQARNIEKAIVTYCIDSGDWQLDGTTSGGGIKADSETLIKGLLQEVTYKSVTYGPMLTPKYPDKDNAHADNVDAYLPQWNPDGGGEYIGWSVEVYPKKQTVKVDPVTTGGGIGVTIH